MSTVKDRILIVEDEKAIRDMLGYALMKQGFNCDQATDAEQARSAIKSHRPSLILLDWMLPEISGIDYARRLRNVAETRDIPIIMLTAKGEEADKIRGLETVLSLIHISEPTRPY